jgi:hypothetical protein
VCYFYLSNSRFLLFCCSVSVVESVLLEHFLDDILPLRVWVVVFFGLALELELFLG